MTDESLEKIQSYYESKIKKLSSIKANQPEKYTKHSIDQIIGSAAISNKSLSSNSKLLLKSIILKNSIEDQIDSEKP